MSRNGIFLLIIIAAVIAVLYFSIAIANEKYCTTDADCSCGVNVNTGDCFFGNKNFVDASRQCPDFCNGIGANLALVCSNNTCVHSRVIA